ncbi:M15 family metallopeptidase [Pengzhenrongella sicca]|uniref:M15 family metallopeptidase n=1 Tax=Pengzhenrongella sicca TaxID=2819238 RepID=A0A8A4ZED9_9MICO|nr:M15 family metallopeptidase [Pengzhenrongella sicca]QTE30274.1 M15 family metallopeptidase [Pengzhenrongella sicca]
MRTRRPAGPAGALAGALLLAGCVAPGPGEPAPTPRSSAASTVAPAPTRAPSPTQTPTPAPSPTADPALAPAPPPDGAPAPAPAEPVQPPEPAFAATSAPIGPELAARMAPSWRAGCPVPLEELRYLTLTHRGFGGEVVTGELVVHADAVEAVTGVFRALFEAGYPIRSMRLVDDFDADDDASMAADNTSAFNCRAVAGTSSWSEHAYGRAIDLNPVENPYVSGAGVFPPAGAPFADRPQAPGVVHPGDAVVRAFAAAGWGWGGTWRGAKDYQHFSATGR